MPNVNDKPLVTITIEGPLCTAKTSIAAAIAEMLQGADFEGVSFDAGESDVLLFKYLDRARMASRHLQSLTYEPLVTIREVHLNRAGTRRW